MFKCFAMIHLYKKKFMQQNYSFHKCEKNEASHVLKKKV